MLLKACNARTVRDLTLKREVEQHVFMAKYNTINEKRVRHGQTSVTPPSFP